MHILVTGGAGFIGSHLVRWLVGQGHTVRILDNLSTGRRELLAPVIADVELREGDICDMAAVQAASTTVELVIHLAALVSVVQSVADPLQTHRVNATGTLHILEAARMASVRRVVVMSSCAVYGDTTQVPVSEDALPQPLSPYAATKLSAEQWAYLYTRIYALETVVLRGFNIYGPHQDPTSPYAAVIPRFVDALRSGQQPTIYGDGLQSRDFIAVDDVVQALWGAATTPGIAGGVFNIGSGTATSILELTQLLGELLGTTIHSHFAATRPGEVRHSCADISRLQQQTTWRPGLSLRQGLGALIAGVRCSHPWE